MDIVTEFSHHEGSAGQQEIDLRHTDALTMADSIVTFRYIVKTVAEFDGVHATFMPKPFANLDGSAMYMHFSLFEGDTNAFHDPDDEISLSTSGRQFIAGAGRSSASCSAKKASTTRSGATSLPTNLTFALQSRVRT